MDNQNLNSSRTQFEENSLDSGRVVNDNSFISQYAQNNGVYSTEVLEVNDGNGAPRPRPTEPMMQPRLNFSKRKAMIVSMGIMLVVALLLFGSLSILVRKDSGNHSASSLGPQQDINLKDASVSSIPKELQGAAESLLVNGDVVVRGNIKVSQDGSVTVIKVQQSGANQTVTLPSTSGTFCLDTNNCNYAGANAVANLQNIVNNLQAQLSAIGPVPTAGVDSLNGQKGAVSIQGSLNQIVVNSAGGVVTISTPQNLDANANVQFGNLTVSPTGQITANKLVQTGIGSNVSIDAGTDGIIFTANGRTFQFPNSGVASQTICTTVTCAGAGGSVASIDGETGTVLINNATGNGSGTITIDDATTAAKGIASFSNTNFSVVTGVVTIKTAGVTTLEVADGTITGTDIASGTVTNSNLQNSSLTVTAGSGLVNGGSVSLGGTTTLNVGAGDGISVAADTVAVDATVCRTTGNCTTAGSAGGDLTGTYPNPTIAKLQGTDLNISGPTAGQILVYNVSNNRWENRSVSGDITISETGVVNIATGSVGSAEIADGTITGTDIANSTVTNSNLANSSLTVTAGNGLINGGSVSLGGVTTLNVGAGDGITVAADTVAVDATVCRTTGNCAGAGSGVTAATPGTANRLAVFTAGQDITSSWLIQNGSTLELDNTRNLSLLGGNLNVTGTGTFSSTAQATRFISTVATGTAPLTVASTTLVSNFNADLLDGQSGAFYQDASNLNAGTLNSARISGAYNGLTGSTALATVGTITAGTWNGTAIADGFLQDNITISSAGTVDWLALNNYPAACAAGSAITQLGDSITCSPFASSAGSGSYIQNQNAVDQVADFRISGSGQASTLTSTVATGTAPFTVASTTVVANLNADRLDGQDGAYYLDLANATGTLNPARIADGSLGNTKLTNSSLTVTAGTGLSGGGAVALGASTSLAVVYGSTANTSVQGNTAVTITAGTGLTGGSTITLGAGGSSTLNVAYGSSAGTAVQGNTSLTCASGTGNLSGGGNTVTLGTGGSCNNLTITNSPIFSGTLAVQGATATIGADSQQGSVVLYDGGTGVASHTGTVQVIGSLAQNTTYILPDPAAGSATICLSTGNCAGSGGGVTTPGGVNGNIAKFTGSGTIDDSTLSESGTTLTATGNFIIQGSNSLTLGTSSSLDGSVTFRTAAGNNTVSLQAPAANPAGNLTFRLPSAYGANGDCLVSDGAGGMTFMACPGGGGGGGVTSIDGETGVVLINNATGNGSGTITIDDATTAAKGIASFNSANFGVSGGAVSIATGGVGSTEIANGSVTGTDIANATITNSNLVNSGVTVSAGTNLTGGGAVALGGTVTLNVTNSPSFSGTLGVTGASSLDGGATIRGVTVNTATATEDQIIIAVAAAGTNRFNGTITNADLTANQTYTLPNASGTVCLSNGNCAGAGSGVTAATPGTANRLAVFTAGQDITSSWLVQNGSDLELDNTRNFELLGGNITANGTITGTQLSSTVATGTAPLTVASTTLVSNFNADLLDGQTGSFYQDATNLTAGTVASARLSGSYTGITGVGTITAGTWNGTAIADGFLQDNITISNLGTVDWLALNNYPAACAAGSAISTIGDTPTCTAFATGTTASYIQNQSASDQTADFRISGTGRANTALQTPLLDTATGVALNIGTTNATIINLNKNVEIASQQSIRFVGGTTAQRPASPTVGMLYYDSTTKQLLQWNGTKWVGDHSTATKIVAASNSLQEVKDAADYVADGTSDQVEINAALAVAPGGTVYLAEGTYTIDGTILVPNQTTLAGSNKNTTVLNLSIGSGSDNLIENSNTTNGVGIVIHDLLLNNVGATGGTQNGIYLSGMEFGNTNSHIYNLVSSWTFGSAVIVEDGTLYKFTNNSILGPVAVRGINSAANIHLFTDNVVVTGNLTVTGGAIAGSNALIEKLSNNVTESLILTGATGYARVGAATSNTIYNDVTVDATNGTANMTDFTGNNIADDVTLMSGVATSAAITTFSNNTIGGDIVLNGSTVVSTVTTLTGNYISGNLSLNGATISTATSNAISGSLNLNGATSASSIVTFSGNWTAGTTTLTSGSADAAIFTFTGNTATGTVTVDGSGGSDAFILDMSGNTFTSLALNTITAEPMAITGNLFYASAANVLALTNADNVSITNNKFHNFGGATNAININNTSSGTYLADNTLGGLALVDAGTNTIYASQLNAAGNLLLQPTGTIELLKNTNVTGTLNITSDVDTNGSLTVGNANQFVISNLGVVTSGTWQGTAITDTYVADTLTVNSSSTVDWQALNNYPSACAAGSAVSTLSDTPTCTAFATGTTASYIQNQNGSAQSSSNFWVSGSGRADTSFLAPLFDTGTAAVLNIGTTNATAINLNKHVTVASGQKLTITGGNTASRAGLSPTEGAVYYDTDTKQLLTYANGKWQADRGDAIYVAASNSSQTDRDRADYLANGDTGAAGDGDQVEINQALIAASGKKVVLLAGTYTVDASISVPNNTTLEGVGHGSLITIPNAQNGTYNVITNTTTGGSGTGVTIRDLRLDGNKANQSSGTMNGIFFDGMGSGTGSSAIQGAKVTNVSSNNWFGGAGIRFAASSNNIVTGNMAQNNDQGIRLFTTHNNTITGNTTQGNGQQGIVLNTSTNTTISGNIGQGNGTSAIYIFNSSNYNTVTGNTGIGNGSAAVAITSASYNTVTGNTSQGNVTGFFISSANYNTINGNKIDDNGGATNNDGVYLTASDNNTITSNNITDSSCSSTCYAINVFDATSDTNYLADNTLGGGTINNAGTGTIYGGQLNSSNNFVVQPAGTIELMKNTNVTGTLNITSDVDTNGSLTVGNANQFVISNTGVVTSGTWNGTALTDTYVADTLTVDSASSVHWNALNNYPAACAAGSAISQLADTTNTCTAFAASSGSGSYIQNQFAGQQATSEFWISGRGRADTSILTPLLDTATGVALNIGTTNATQINLNKSVVLAAAQTLKITGGTTANRATDVPAPTEGMVYYDTTTKQLLTYSNGKWQADRGDAIYVAASNSSQTDKDRADYLGNGDTGSAGDGDQVEINQALTAASGKKVVLLAGTYTIDADISVPNNTTLSGVGYGTLITVPNNFNTNINAITNITTGGSGTGIRIDNLRLDGNQSNQSGGTMYGIHMNGVGSGTGSSAIQGAKITNTWINNWNSRGIYINGSSNNTITGNTAQGNTNAGFYFSAGSHYNSVTGNNAQGNTNIGFYLNSNSNTTLTGNTSQGNDIGFYMPFSTNNTLTGNTSHGNTSAGFYLSFSTNNTLTGNTSQNNNGTGFLLDSSSNNTLTGNTSQNNLGSGFSISTSHNNTISSNKAHDNGDTTNNNGISLADSDTNSITSNNISDTSCGTGTANCYGVNITNAGSDANYVADNYITDTDGDATAGIQNLGTGTIFGGQVNGSTNFVVQPAGTIELMKNTNVTGILSASTSVLAPTVDTATAVQLNIGNTNASSISVGKTGSNIGITLSGTTIIKTTSGNDSATAFQVQNGAGNTIFGVDTSAAQALLGKASTITGKMVVYNSTNANTITIQSGVTSSSYTLTLPTALGSSGHCLKDTNGSGALGFSACTSGGATRKITLVPEYPGGVISADGSNNTGTLTSDFDGTNVHNYYTWTSTQGSLNDYDVIVRTPLPSEYVSGFGTFKIWAYGGSTSTSNNNIQVSVKDASGTSCASNVSVLPGTASLWVEQTVTLSGCTFAANDLVFISIKLSSLSSNAVRIGEISYQYTN